MKICFLITIPVLLFFSCRNSTKTASGTLEQQSVEVLETILTTGKAWEKVHAAEFLIELGDTSKVLHVFLSESDKNSHIPEYRIGIWRVLYRCAGKDEKQAWQDSIYRAFVHSTSPDRVHAVETLAKLKIAGKNTDSAIIRSALGAPDQRLSFYTQWWIAPQKENGIDGLKDHLFQIIQSGEVASVRQLAAYVLCEDMAIRFNNKEWEIVRNLAISEPATPVQLQLLAAAFSKSTVDSVQPASLQRIKAMMLECTASDKSSLYQLCLSLARKGKKEDMNILAPFLLHQENDVKTAAAYAILRIDKELK